MKDEDFYFGYCGDCLVEEGKFHDIGCDQERCSVCKRQPISCGCNPKPKLKEPFFRICFTCIRCGKKNPKLLMVSDKEWKFICGSTYELEEILCPECMKFIINKRNKIKRSKNGSGRNKK